MKQHSKMLFHTTLKAPIGLLKIVNSEIGVRRIILPSESDDLFITNLKMIEDTRLLRPVCDELTAYFDGTLKKFTVPIDLQTTQFRKLALNEVNCIEYGKTASYKEIAERIRNPKAVRAVGGANAHNPIPIIIPCHRVVAHDGTLGGYGGGLEMKKYLLRLEGSLFD